MKKINYLIIILLIPVFFSCDEFLDKQPLDQLSPATFWKTQNDADMALAGVYSRIQNWDIICDGQGRMGLGGWDNLTDNAFCELGDFDFNKMSNGKIYPTVGMISEVYNGAYQKIAACNNFLDNIGTVKWSDEAIGKQYSAEVRFLRAWSYYWLTQCFGDVPLITQILPTEKLTLSRAPKADVLKQMYDDLDYAIANLPDKAYSGAKNNSGHLVKGSALAFKARVKLFNGEFSEAATLAKQVISGGKFSLAPNYTSNFTEDGGQDNCPEILFSIKFKGPEQLNRIEIIYGWWKGCNPIQEFIDCHEKGDLRLKLNVTQAGEAWPISLTWNPGYGGILPKGRYLTNTVWNKFYNPSTTAANWNTRGNDNVQIRYAEVLLVFAEAQNESSGPNADVYAAVNALRNRALLPNLPAGLSKSEMQEKIRNERRVELVLEGQRYFDLKRWRIAGDVIPKLNYPPNQNVVKRYWDDHLYLWPLPQNEIDKDPVHLIQTPGY